ncbi:MAG TPA: biopolymer transporter ExbD [Kofleriaceae bacterium]|jgi:biopolymer transport protein ExbD|nr:biopolymer transporter ExbD [Kofleriaceae bacterium]
MAGGAMRRRGMITEINVTPLVDIMLVLLIIFMLTAHLIARQAIEIELPHASQSTAPPPTTLAIALKADGAMFLNDRPVTADALRAALKDAVAKDPKAQAVVAGDKRVSHGRVVWVLDAVKSAGITQFAIQIDPHEIVAPGESDGGGG